MQPIAFFSMTESDLRTMLLSTLRESLPALLAAATAASPTEPGPLTDSDVYLTRAEAAQFLRIGVVTLRNLERRGEITPDRIGRRVLYRKSDLVAAVGRCGESSLSTKTRRGRR
jgi:excisionase family DNA binding protein